jgi:hypothetical protein
MARPWRDEDDCGDAEKKAERAIEHHRTDMICDEIKVSINEGGVVYHVFWEIFRQSLTADTRRVSETLSGGPVAYNFVIKNCNTSRKKLIYRHRNSPSSEALALLCKVAPRGLEMQGHGSHAMSAIRVVSKGWLNYKTYLDMC